MKQAVMTSPGVILIHEAPAPRPGAGEVLLEIQRIGICGSDVHVYHGKHPFTKYPVVQGHEFSAVIRAVGEGVVGLTPGMKATSMPQIFCGECAPCRRGDTHICDHLKVEGFQSPGCAQELWVTDASKVIVLPDSFSFEQGALVEPLAVAVRAVFRAGNISGRRVVVLGAGTIGNLVAQAARAQAEKVLITDISDHRLEIARQCGLEHTSNPRVETLLQASQRVFGEEGFDVALECVGIEATVSSAVSSIQKGGTLVVVGVFGEKPRVDMELIQDRELNIHGTLMYKVEDYRRAVELIATGKMITEPLMSKHFPFEAYLDAYHFIESEGERCMKVFIDVRP